MALSAGDDAVMGMSNPRPKVPNYSIGKRRAASRPSGLCLSEETNRYGSTKRCELCNFDYIYECLHPLTLVALATGFLTITTDLHDNLPVQGRSAFPPFVHRETVLRHYQLHYRYSGFPAASLPSCRLKRILIPSFRRRRRNDCR
jgi:hypothetical protein